MSNGLSVQKKSCVSPFTSILTCHVKSAILLGHITCQRRFNEKIVDVALPGCLIFHECRGAGITPEVDPLFQGPAECLTALRISPTYCIYLNKLICSIAEQLCSQQEIFRANPKATIYRALNVRSDRDYYSLILVIFI